MVRREASENDTPLPPPAKTLEGRNDQLVAAAFNLVEQRIHNQTASAQETVHFLRQGSPSQRLQMEKLEAENEVLKARVKEMESRTGAEALMEKAIRAFKGYSGEIPIDPDALGDEYDEDTY